MKRREQLYIRLKISVIYTNRSSFIVIISVFLRSGKRLVIVRHIRLPVGLICGYGAKLL